MPNRKVPPKEILQALYAEGRSAREIAEHLGLNPITVASALLREGISVRTPSETKALQRERGIKTKAGRYWLGKKQPRDMVERRVEKIRGENHYLWKGGKDRRQYRRIIKKEMCARCGIQENLGIHHKDLDHYNDVPENLEVLCVSCHSSVHKQAYWDAIHAGEEPPRSNAPNNWRPKGGDAHERSRVDTSDSPSDSTER